MAEFETDEERVEAIKKWWKNNGVAVVAGIVIGLGGVIGWRAWIGHQTTHAQRASIAFEQLQMGADMGDAEATAKQAEILVDDFGDTPYAGFALLTAARVAVESGNLEAAAEALADALEEAPDPALAQLAALRLARVQIALGELDAARKTIASRETEGAFRGDFAALRGDIAAAEGRIDEARGAYEDALASNPGNARLIELKLQNLPDSEAS